MKIGLFFQPENVLTRRKARGRRRLASLAVAQTGARPTKKAEAAAGARQSRLLEGGEDRLGRAALPAARGAQQCAEPLGGNKWCLDRRVYLLSKKKCDHKKSKCPAKHWGNSNVGVMSM